MQGINYNGTRVVLGCLPPSAAGIFESMRWDNGIALWDLHFERLHASAVQLDFLSSVINKKLLWNEIEKTVAMNPRYDFHKIRLSIFQEGDDIHFLVESSAYIPFEGALKLGIASVARKNYHEHSHLKTIARNEYEQVQLEAARNGWDDAILLNDSGQVVETAIANIFWKKNDQLYTVPTDAGCISGVGRRHFVLQHPVTVQNITPGELMQADEVFLTNALRGIIPVASIAGTYIH